MLQTKNYIDFIVNNESFSGSINANRALPGDDVEVDNGKVYKIIKRNTHKNIVGILEVKSNTRYGFTKRGIPIYLFKPWNSAYPPFYVGSSYPINEKKEKKNIIVLVDFISWNSDIHLPRGDCRKIFGECGDLEAEEAAILMYYRPNSWKLKDETKIQDSFISSKKIEFQSGITFHVDPKECRDIDDAITLESHNENIKVNIHIADVATKLSTNSWIWEIAENTGLSLYLDGKIVSHMLPPAIEEECSLLPGMLRKTLTLSFEWNSSLKVVNNIEWSHREICIKESYTYDSIYKSSWSTILKSIAESLYPTTTTLDSHTWIESFMKFYNVQAAKILRTISSGILRRHEEIKYNIDSNVFSDKFFGYKAGEYCLPSETNVKHAGLNEDVYCHITSPIRRWSDCINQINLMNYLFGYSLLPKEASPSLLNLNMKTSKKYEKDILYSRLLLCNTSKKLYGKVIEINNDKFKILLNNTFIIISIKKIDSNNIYNINDLVQIKYYANPDFRNWKKRIIFELEHQTKIGTA